MRRLIPILCIFALAIGCDDPEVDEEETPAEEEEEEMAEEEEVEEEEAEEEIEMAEYELTEAGEDWEGWTVTAKEGLDILQDGVGDARLTEDGDQPWDLLISQDHTDLEEHKENLQSRAEDNEERTVEFITEEENLLAWTSVYETDDFSSTTWNFTYNVDVDETEIGCENNARVGLGSEEMLELHIEACDTIAAPTQEGDAVAAE